ncbi:hypothetical protein DIPPA_12511 [Diplonema papillatum]|nr:hypothetical protein DIPPA_12511 [Diplonema papillatum]
MGRVLTRVKERLRHSRRIQQAGVGQVYEPVAALAVGHQEYASAGGGDGQFVMSDAMRDALAKVDLNEARRRSAAEALAAADADSAAEQEIEKLEEGIRKQRYNASAPLALDWRAVPWLSIVQQLLTDTSKRITFFDPSHDWAHASVHNSIYGYPTFPELAKTRGCPHPVAMLFQLWGRDNYIKYNGRPAQLTARVVALAFRMVKERALSTTSRSTLLLELRSAQALWANGIKFRGLSPMAAYHFFDLLVVLNEEELLESLVLPKGTADAAICAALQHGAVMRLQLSSGDDDAAGAVAEFAKKVLSAPAARDDGGHVLTQAERFFSCFPVVLHLLRSRGLRSAKRVAAKLALTPDDFKPVSRVVWQVLTDFASNESVPLATAYAIIHEILPFHPRDMPQANPEELLEVLIGKHARLLAAGRDPAAVIRAAYVLLKQGNNAGLPKYQDFIRIPPPRGGMRGVMRVAAAAGDPEKVRKLFQFMLSHGCRPDFESVHWLLTAHAAKSAAEPHREMYKRLVKWVSVTPEIAPADATVVQGFKQLVASSSGEVFDAFESTVCILGWIDRALVSVLVEKLVVLLENPIEAFVELTIYASSALFTCAYQARNKLPLRIGAPEVVCGVLVALESFGKAFHLGIIEPPLADCHAQWGGGAYTVRRTKAGGTVFSPENPRGGAALAYTSPLPVADAWLLAGHGFYDVKPKALIDASGAVPAANRDADSILLIHWSALMWCREAEALFGAGTAVRVVPARQLHWFLTSMADVVKELVATEKVAQDLRAVACDSEFGRGVKQAVDDARQSAAEPTRLTRRARNIIENHAAYLPYTEELSLVADATTLRDPTSNEPSHASFVDIAVALSERHGLPVTCIVDSPSARLQLEAELRGVRGVAPEFVSVRGSPGEDASGVVGAWERQAGRAAAACRAAARLVRRVPALDEVMIKKAATTVGRQAPDNAAADEVLKHQRRERGYVSSICRPAPPSSLLQTAPWLVD